MRKLLAAIMVVSFNVSAMGNAPYCLALPYGLQCVYYNWSQCQTAANQQHVPCVVNPDKR